MGFLKRPQSLCLWRLKVKHFHVELDPISKVLRAISWADIPRARHAPDADALRTAREEVIAQAKPAVVRLKGRGKGEAVFSLRRRG